MKCQSGSDIGQRPMPQRLTAGNDAQKFDAVALGQIAVRPLASIQRDAVVFDQDGLRWEIVAIDEFSHCLCAAGIGVLSV